MPGFPPFPPAFLVSRARLPGGSRATRVPQLVGTSAGASLSDSEYWLSLTPKARGLRGVTPSLESQHLPFPGGALPAPPRSAPGSQGPRRWPARHRVPAPILPQWLGFPSACPQRPPRLIRLTLRSRRPNPRSPPPHRPPSGSWRACPPLSLRPGSLQAPRTRARQRPGPACQPLAAPSRGRALRTLRFALRRRARVPPGEDPSVCTGGARVHERKREWGRCEMGYLYERGV